MNCESFYEIVRIVCRLRIFRDFSDHIRETERNGKRFTHDAVLNKIEYLLNKFGQFA